MPVCDKPIGRYPTPVPSAGNAHRSEIIVRKSKFLTHAFHAASGKDAREGIAQIRLLHSDATHNCWAYAAGPPASTADIGCSDDGEPHGTAGKPMLNVLLHSGIGEICVVVTRWFGGIKLGTGGLARAYQDAVLENLKILNVKERVPLSRWSVNVDYHFLTSLRKFLPEVEGAIADETYHQQVELQIDVPEDKVQLFLGGIARLSNGATLPRLMAAVKPQA